MYQDLALSQRLIVVTTDVKLLHTKKRKATHEHKHNILCLPWLHPCSSKFPKEPSRSGVDAATAAALPGVVPATFPRISVVHRRNRGQGSREPAP